jgi:hypothetical protein
MTKIYSSILDQILSDLAPNPSEVGLKSEISRGEEFENISQSEEDAAFVNELAPRVASVAADWRQKAQASFSNGGLLEEAALRSVGSKAAGEVEKTALTNDQVKRFISDRLHMGRRPSQVADDLEKLSDLHVFEKGLASDVLSDMSGVVGYTYLEPNHFHDTCQASLERISREGKVIAKSVKRIAACSSCTGCVGGSCSVYKLPIIASKGDLKELVEKEASKIGKSASKKTMAELHDWTPEAKSVTSYSHATQIAGFEHIAREAEKTITKEHIAAQVEASPLVQVFSTAAETFGKVAAKRAVNGYLNSLKTSKAKVSIDNVDCRLLVGKLSSGNAIVGSKKCPECVYRNCMSCGLTGGTLISFPGMNTVKSAHKVAAGAKSGEVILAEYQLESTEHQSTDVDVSGYSFDDVEAKGPLTLE